MAIVPTKCPVCGSAVRSRTPETNDDFEEIEFDCRCIIQRQENGKWRADSCCRVPTKIAIDILNRA